jgi:hypothetical protein
MEAENRKSVVAKQLPAPSVPSNSPAVRLWEGAANWLRCYDLRIDPE